MTNTIENNIFDSHFKSATYINSKEDNWKWSFSKKDTNSSSGSTFNIISLLALGILIFSVYNIF